MSLSAPPPTSPAPAEETVPGVLYCANHPTVETGLRCATCNKPICAKCAKRTPTGYRCKECISGIQKNFDTSQWYDYPVAFTIAGVLALVGSFVATLIGFFIVFLAPVIGVVISEVIRFVTRRRRSNTLFKVAAAGTALGSLAFVIVALFGMVFFSAGARSGSFLTSGLISLVFQGIYAFTVTSTVYYRLRGISIR